MGPISPTELAQLLQLSTGADGAAFKLTMGVALEAFDRLASTTGDGCMALNVQESYAEEFCSQYLPSFIRTILIQDEAQAIVGTQIFEWLLSHSPPSLPRFVRDHPEKACQLYPFVAEQLAALFETKDIYLVREDGVHLLIRAIPPFVSLLTILTRYLPPSSTIPRLPARSKAGVSTVAFFCRDDPKVSSVWDSQGREFSTVALMGLTAALDMNEYREWLLARPDPSMPTVWWTCELGRRWRGVFCAEAKEGEQMRACSRCIAVRYCSRVHQKADWKRHKLVCFKPSW